MALIEPLPKDLEAALRGPEANGDEPLVAVASDLSIEGAFGEEWLVVTGTRLRVYAANGASRTPRLNLALAELERPRADSLVGGGALRATVRGEQVELIRYTNARQHTFGRVAKYLGDWVKYRDAQKEKDSDARKDAAEAQAREAPERKPLKKPEIHPDPDEEQRCPKCRLVLPNGTRVCPACLNKLKALQRLVVFLRPYWKSTAVIWVLMFISMVLNVIPPYLTRPLTDRVLAPQDGAPSVAERLSLLAWLVGALFLVGAAGQVVRIVRGRLLVTLSTRLSHDLRMQLYQHLQILSLRFFDKRQTGAVAARVTQDTGSLQNVLLDGTQFILVNLLTLLAICAVLFWMNWMLALLLLLPVPILWLLSNYVWKRLHRMWQRFWHFRERLSASVHDSLSGVRVVKAFAQEAQEVRRFSTRSDELKSAGASAERAWATLVPVLGFVTGLGALIVWYVGGRQVVNGEMSLGTLMAFAAYLGLFYGPMQYLSQLSNWAARSLAAAERIFEILDSVPDVPDAADARPLPRIEGNVAFEDVTFGYDRHKPVLKNVTFRVEPGEMIGLVGHSGAGKSTTLNLLCRFYDVNEGRILIDGVDIQKIRQADLRSQIGVVLQETFLFNGTIAENIGYAKAGASRDEILAAAQAANAHDFIVQKPDGYDTQVGERGQKLSGGERQRIAIARAILHDPRLLILDEATSSVDTDTEKKLQDAIARLVKGRTTFAIAHRLSTLRHADRLVVLKDGAVQELGSHAELMEKKGEFHRLVKMQGELSKIVGVAG